MRTSPVAIGGRLCSHEARGPRHPAGAAMGCGAVVRRRARDYVGQVAEALKGRGGGCFYEADELPVIYGEQAAAVVMFVSAEYAAREWTRLERQAALARALRERREYVLP